MTTPFSIDCVFSDNFDELKKLNVDELKECDDIGRNVFHAACSKANLEMLNYLIEKLGSESILFVNSRDNRGNTPTHYACGLVWEESKFWERNEE